jgi:hypothetical protein
VVLRLLLVPLNLGTYYTLTVDGRLPKTFLRYLAWAIAPGRVGDPGVHNRPRDLAVAAVIGLALAAFVLWRLRGKQLMSLFCAGWFVLLLAPVLPLPNHMQRYYVTLPVLGLAWLGGWGIAAGWRSGWAGRVAALVLAGYYLWGSIKEADVTTSWFLERSERMRVVVLGLREGVRRHPGSAFLLQGVTPDLFNSGFQDDPFRLLGPERVYLAPGTEGIEGRADLGGPAHYLISASAAMSLLERGEARVLSVSQEGLRDITTQYRALLASDPAVSRRDFVDAGDPRSDPYLGPTWYPADQGFRWMPKTATVKFSGQFPRTAKLYVTGYVPSSVVASGPVTLSFHAAGHLLGSQTFREPDKLFALQYPMPEELAGQTLVEISVEVDKVFRPEHEQRELGMVFGTFGIR